MDDLDSLLEDLGRGKNNSIAVKKSRPPSSRVDLNELEDLMEDLAAPTSKQTPVPTPVAVPSRAVMSETSSSGNTNGVSSASASPPTTTFRSYSAPKSSTPANSTLDDLDALMESLSATSRNSNRKTTSTKPVVLKEPQPTQVTPPAETKPPVVDIKPVYTPPVYNPPVQTQQRTTSVAPSSGVGDDLDKLLNNLTKQMNNVDVSNPSSRGTCATCGAAILGELVQAMGRTFHPEHFACGSCRESLGSKPFFETNGVPYCERCYKNSYCPKCAHCDQPISDRCVTALNKKWHSEHFLCTTCLKPFSGGVFFEKDGRAYCEDDFNGLFSPKCQSCKEAIKGDCINALGGQWHPEHFSCTYCQKSFNGASFFEYNGKPYCETHYHQQTGSLCSGCGKPITGRCVNALGKKWHPEHFVCAFCMNPLSGSSFTEHNSKAYCKECHGKLFGGH